MHKGKVLAFVAGSALSATTCFAANMKGVQVIPHESERRVDVTIDGQPFTSYIWPTTLKKPTLFPIVAEDGTTVTRGYPLDPQPGERTDHPHHAGLWFNYGNVNGFDFWNNSDAIKPEDRGKMGSVVDSRIDSAKSGTDRGELVTEAEWVAGNGDHLLHQKTRHVFSKRPHGRVIDEVITLKALQNVTFRDDKEGVFGMRVARWLESPTEKGGTFTDASGRPTTVQSGDNSIATGVYLTSEGAKGDAAWGTRGRWCALTGHTGDHTESIVILDHPKNPGYPTYWHARGYGLFSANPLGRSIFDPKQPPLNLELQSGKEITFRYRVLVISGEVNAAQLNREADAFASETSVH